MKQKTKDIIGALLLGLLCTLALSAVITVADTETARTDLMIGMQYETTGLDLDAAPGLLLGLSSCTRTSRWTPGLGGLRRRGWPRCSTGCAASARPSPDAPNWC